MHLWKVAGALHKPEGIRLQAYVLKGQVNVFFLILRIDQDLEISRKTIEETKVFLSYESLQHLIYERQRAFVSYEAKHQLKFYFHVMKRLRSLRGVDRIDRGKNQLIKANGFILGVFVFKRVTYSEKFMNVFVWIIFNSTIKLVSFDESQVVTYNAEFVCGFMNCDYGTGSRSDNMVGSPHRFIIHWIVIFKNIQKVTEIVNIKDGVDRLFLGVRVVRLFVRKELSCFVNEVYDLRFVQVQQEKQRYDCRKCIALSAMKVTESKQSDILGKKESQRSSGGGPGGPLYIRGPPGLKWPPRFRSLFCLFVMKVVPGVEDVVFDGEFGGVGDEEVVVKEGVVVISSLLYMLTNSCLGGIMMSLIFLEGLDEEALVEFMVEWCEEDEDDDDRNEEDHLFN
nr:hypothetical protein [Tanacetum cinerariifolium]